MRQDPHRSPQTAGPRWPRLATATAGPTGLSLALAAVAVVQALWLLHGLDVTDTGFHIAKQYSLFDELRDPYYDTSDMSFLSHAVARMWSKLSPWPRLLLWERLGYLIQTLIGLYVTYRALRYYFPAQALILPLLIDGLVLQRSIPLIHQYTFPRLIFAFLFLCYAKSSAAKLGTRSFRVYGLLCGALSLVAIVARPPLMTILLFPLLTIAVAWATKQRSALSRALHHAVWWYGGVVLLIPAVVLLALTVPAFGHALQSLSTSASGQIITSAETYDLMFQIEGWIDRYSKIGMFCLALIGAASLAVYLPRERERPQSRAPGGLPWWLWASVGVFLLWITNWDTPFRALSNGLSTMLFIPKLMFAGFLLFAGHVRADPSPMALQRLSAYGLALWVMLITPLGSDTFAFKFGYGFSLALQTSIALVLSLGQQTLDTPRATAAQRRVLAIFAMLLLPAVLSAGFERQARFFSDDPGFLSAAAGHSSLRHIRSTPARIDTIEQAARTIEEHAPPGSRILCLGRIPLFYYMTDTRPYITSPWPFQLGPQVLRQALDENQRIWGLPRLVVIAPKNAHDIDWPDTDRPSLPKPVREVVAKFLKQHRYRRLYRNDGFIIYQAPETHR